LDEVFVGTTARRSLSSQKLDLPSMGCEESVERGAASVPSLLDELGFLGRGELERAVGVGHTLVACIHRARREGS
jgi:hypothetical protein